MNTSDDITKSAAPDGSDAPEGSKRVRLEDVLLDLHAGMRSKPLMVKYGLNMGQFEELMKSLVQRGLFTREQFRAWRSHAPIPPPYPKQPAAAAPEPPAAPAPTPQKLNDDVETFVLEQPEKNHAWALQLFSMRRETMHGAQFKVNLQGRKYAFVIERLLYRGQVKMLEARPRKKTETEFKAKREAALEFISQHGWQAYLETRAYEANFGADGLEREAMARLVLLQCRNGTFVAALHTPTPAVNLYVGQSLDTIRRRLAKNIDMSTLHL